MIRYLSQKKVEVVDKSSELAGFGKDFMNLPRFTYQKNNKADIDLEKQHMKTLRWKYLKRFLALLCVILIGMAGAAVAAYAGARPEDFQRRQVTPPPPPPQ